MISSKIRELNTQGVPSVSFEFFPPRDDSSTQALGLVLDQIVAVRPDFVSVTYGAGGSNQSRSFDMVRSLAPRVPTVGHLTCVGATRQQLGFSISSFVELGAAAILALRGDAPAAQPELKDLTELHSALELMELIEEVTDLEIGVAAFPERHPDSPSIDHDIEVLLKKQTAGAKFAITQLFFYAEDYLTFVDKAKAAGVTIPILPGILPINSMQQIERMTKLSHARKPVELMLAMEAVQDDQAGVAELGFQYTLKLCRELLAREVLGLHIFCLNQAETPIRLVRELELR